MELKAGTRLRSQVCTTEVMVVKAPANEIELTCGGAALVSLDAAIAADGAPAAGLDTGTQLGKRYTAADDDSLELLVTKAGAGTLAAAGVPLVFKEAKALPASD